ncbi:MAG: AbrB/MazE/SpoVT family DNA-binding domain-containing protein [Bacteroidetes bacterium]|nr:AbrB/MazE/SpoVT family DNA-binding domain-containing protein [Bacteroidota bacterium]
MKTSQITQKGQVLIPISIRKKYGLTTGSKVIVSDDGQNIKVIPITSVSIRSMAGILKGKNLSKALLESRKKEKAANR